MKQPMIILPEYRIITVRCNQISAHNPITDLPILPAFTQQSRLLDFNTRVDRKSSNELWDLIQCCLRSCKQTVSQYVIKINSLVSDLE